LIEKVNFPEGQIETLLYISKIMYNKASAVSLLHADYRGVTGKINANISISHPLTPQGPHPPYTPPKSSTYMPTPYDGKIKVNNFFIGLGK
jgi:hypothetical protein